ncbi:MAG: DeoR/GlpR transcriptional regulator [Ignavibacteriales bacterium]|nr:DeoR/GlpR transcriptional regulator [Ignavibacteriales bacterium]
MFFNVNKTKKQILEYLSEREDASVGELSEIFKVSEVTIRTDLNFLADEEKIVRTHGRARLLGERTRAENSFEVRKKQNFEQKIKIGKEAAKLVNSNDSLLLDSSSTGLAMAMALRERTDLKETTVIPTGIWTAIELMGLTDINVLMPSGYLRHTSGSITGSPTRDFFSSLNIQKAFLGAWGISLENGITDSHLLEIELKNILLSALKK